jgi:hypothetical protein
VDPTKQLLIDAANLSSFISENIQLNHEWSLKEQAEQAERLLDSLRVVRDEEPQIWDDMISGPLGPVVCRIWDFLRYSSKSPASMRCVKGEY